MGAARDMTAAEQNLSIAFHHIRFLDHLLRISAEPIPGVTAEGWLPAIEGACKEIIEKIQAIPGMEKTRCINPSVKSVVIGPDNVNG